MFSFQTIKQLQQRLAELKRTLQKELVLIYIQVNKTFKNMWSVCVSGHKHSPFYETETKTRRWCRDERGEAGQIRGLGHVCSCSSPWTRSDPRPAAHLLQHHSHQQFRPNWHTGDQLWVSQTRGAEVHVVQRSWGKRLCCLSRTKWPNTPLNSIRWFLHRCFLNNRVLCWTPACRRLILG